MDSLMKLKKRELIYLYGKEQQRADEQFDRAETLEKEKEELEEELEEKIGFEDTLDIAKDLMERIKASRWKLSLGVESEREELEKLTEKLEEILS
jgi:beta-phosphoglucomutase-like phosphatase (HAD superfamily)